jgi:hypothetical protein
VDHAAGAPRPALATLQNRILDLEIPVLAIDGPTGIDLKSGIVHGAARADLSEGELYHRSTRPALGPAPFTNPRFFWVLLGPENSPAISTFLR